MSISRLVHRVGLEDVTRAIISIFRKDLNYYYDRQTVEIMKKTLRHDSNCIDVGAHYGSILKKMIKFAPDGHHMAFEPIPPLYEYLKKRFNQKAMIVNSALGDKIEKIGFNYIVNAPGYSGIKQIYYEGVKPKIQKLIVNMQTLDSIFPQNRKLDFIKLDVEGAEFMVLQGGKEVINKWKPIIIFEFGLGGADYYGTKPKNIYTFFNDCEMNISLLGSFLNKKDNLSQEAFVTQYEDAINYYFIAYSSSYVDCQ
jgi:FkbM family methyltransferase